MVTLSLRKQSEIFTWSEGIPFLPRRRRDKLLITNGNSRRNKYSRHKRYAPSRFFRKTEEAALQGVERKSSSWHSRNTFTTESLSSDIDDNNGMPRVEYVYRCPSSRAALRTTLLRDRRPLSSSDCIRDCESVLKSFSTEFLEIDHRGVLVIAWSRYRHRADACKIERKDYQRSTPTP